MDSPLLLVRRLLCAFWDRECSQIGDWAQAVGLGYGRPPLGLKALVLRIPGLQPKR